MPEHEILYPGLRSASRWRPLKDRFARGESPDAIFPDIQDKFYKQLQQVFKRWNENGVNHSELFNAGPDAPAKLRELVNRIGNDGFAQLLLQNCTAGEPPRDLEAVIRSFLEAVWDADRDHLQIDRLEEGVPESFQNSIMQMLERLTRRLLKDPSRIPRRPPRKKPPTDIDEILGRSLRT